MIDRVIDQSFKQNRINKILYFGPKHNDDTLPYSSYFKFKYKSVYFNNHYEIGYAQFDKNNNFKVTIIYKARGVYSINQLVSMVKNDVSITKGLMSTIISHIQQQGFHPEKDKFLLQNRLNIGENALCRPVNTLIYWYKQDVYNNKYYPEYLTKEYF